MSATAHQQPQEDYEEDDTNDCPICLCPLTSPWGICAPCGHAYCRGCWDQLAANNYQSNVARRNIKQPNCAVCKTACQQFVTVFVDLQLASSNARLSETSCAPHPNTAATAVAGDDNNILDEKIEELTDEWGNLWKELVILHPQIISNSENKNNVERDSSDSNRNNFDQGQREVAAICANFIDLSNDDDDENDCDDTQRTPSSSRKVGEDGNTPSSILQDDDKETEQQTHTILRRLKQLHRDIMQLHTTKQQSSLPMTTQQTQKLRSKLISLQSSNADLSSQLQSFQNEIDSLNAKLENSHKTLTERTVETERERRRAAKLSTEFKLMEESYEKHVAKSAIEKSALRSDISKLQDRVVKLERESGIQNLAEMEEIRRKYTKMSQDVHELRMENVKLKKRLKDDEQQRNRGVLVATTARDKKNIISNKSSRKVSLAGGKRKQNEDRRLLSSRPSMFDTKVTAAAASATSSSTAKSKADDILDGAPSRKRSIQNSLLMSTKRAKKGTSFLK